MKTLFIDCSSGLSGDMFLAAMADLGVDLALLEQKFAHKGFPLSITAEESSSQGLRGKKLILEFDQQQPLRTLKECTSFLQGLTLSDAVYEKSLAALTELAEAEAHVHGIPIEKVHFHEIGAVDTLVDIVGAIWSIQFLECTEIVCSPLPWFQGQIECAHGRLPLPAPATVKLLEGTPVYPSSQDFELVTPTGALLVKTLVDRFAPGPAGTLLKTGIGLGTMEKQHHFNGLRLSLLEHAKITQETVFLLETNVDHLTGEEIGHVITTLMDNGALDVIYLPGIMKKNRPGGLLQVMSSKGDLMKLQDSMYSLTMSLGIRCTPVQRTMVSRELTSMSTPYGSMESKTWKYHGKTWNKPEFDALKKKAKELGLSPVQLRLLLQDRSND